MSVRNGLDSVWSIVTHNAANALEDVEAFFYGGLVYVAVAAVMWLLATRSGRRSFAAAREFVFPTATYRAAATKMEYKLFFLSLAFWQPILGWVFTLWGGIALGELLVSWLGARPRIDAPFWLIVTLQSAVIILTRDFGFWLGHYLTHRIPFLWRLHRAHHSAEHLNLFTNFRIHPLDQSFGRACIITCGALGTALVLFLTGTQIEPFTLTVLAVFGFLQLAKDILDHSEVWISLGRLNYIIHTPALHQIHHSAERHHWDKNMGSFFAIWDWMFGTLYIPKGKEEFLKGIDTEIEHGVNNPHQTLRAFYCEPVITLVRYLMGKPVPGVNSATVPATQPEDKVEIKGAVQRAV